MNIAICDDEIESIKQLEDYMQKISEKINNVRWKSFSSAELFLEEYRKDGYC